MTTRIYLTGEELNIIRLALSIAIKEREARGQQSIKTEQLLDKIEARLGLGKEGKEG